MFGRHWRHREERFGRGDFGLGRHFEGRHGMGRAGRFFEQGDLRLVVLKLIADKPSHGYELIRAIEEQLGGWYSPSPGVVYPTLSMLEDQGFATVTQAEGNKKLYAITPEGQAHLDANRAAVDALFDRISEAGRVFSRPAPQIMRAMQNLKMAVRMRLSRGPLTEEQARSIASALDAAATAVERS